jgi:tight adherence protein C
MSISFTDFLSIFGFLIAGLIILGIGLKFFDKSDVDKRIDSFIVEPRTANMTHSLGELGAQNFSDNFLQRTVLIWLNKLISYLGRLTPAQTITETNRRLIIAGSPFNFRAQQYYGVRLLLVMIGLGLGFVTYRSNPESVPFVLASLAIVLAFGLMPEIWLSALMRNRQNQIRQNLPDALDMLSVCTAAGLSFDQSLQRVGQTFKTPIGAEFARVVSEIEIGISRQQALRNLQARIDISEMSSFVAVILQSELLGMSIADVLHSQAEQMRIYRQYRAKEAAQQLPAKMMVPLVFFIFPALLAVLLGPTIPEILKVLQ